ncbi:hypothetical protein IAQ61_007314 [Plenodomus lingam]|uniref:uncharacterized protein n=1 Tax=Leptosphaeria maculans TaxID=5022 RepID=UPI00333473B2|nr:hypothetical protein IAQ61_007314 [Plenodomus lingam]
MPETTVATERVLGRLEIPSHPLTLVHTVANADPHAPAKLTPLFSLHILDDDGHGDQGPFARPSCRGLETTTILVSLFF